jgi:hypothetical protein
MTGGDQPAPGGVFQLVIDGSLGPMLRSALRPSDIEQSRPRTTIRTATHEDLTALVGLLAEHGLVIESVRVLPGPTHPGS